MVTIDNGNSNNFTIKNLKRATNGWEVISCQMISCMLDVMHILLVLLHVRD
jgi:hypothetical protein